MSDFLRRLAERATGAPAEVRPVLPPRFAAAPAALPVSPAADLSESVDGGTDAVTSIVPTPRAASIAPPRAAAAGGSVDRDADVGIPSSDAASVDAPRPLTPRNATAAPRPVAPAQADGSTESAESAGSSEPADEGRVVPVPPRRRPTAVGDDSPPIAPRAIPVVDDERHRSPGRVPPSPIHSVAGEVEPMARISTAWQGDRPVTVPPPAHPITERLRIPEPLPAAPSPTVRPASPPTARPVAPRAEAAATTLPVATMGEPQPAAPRPLAVPTRRAREDADEGRHRIVPAASAGPAATSRAAGETGGASAASVQVAGRAAEPAGPPVIEITIGRVEVRAVAAAPAPRTSRAASPAPAVSLDDYLRARGGGR